MQNVLGCLIHKDSLSYFYLFPPFDTLWSLVMHNHDQAPETVKALNELKEHPQALLQFDPYYNHDILARFERVVVKGEDSGIHWNGVVIQRYELIKEPLTRDLAGYDRISPERFKGYLFVRDMMGRLTFCITITEIQKINGYFFGGQVINILEASTIDEYTFKEKEEKKYYEWLAKNMNSDSAKNMLRKKNRADTSANDTTAGKNKNLQISNPLTEEDKQQVRKEVIDRKYYEGKFDDEIPVKLFIRYLRDVKSGKTSFYDGLYKFGDQLNYVKLNITRDSDGHWVMEDDPPVGSLELELNNRIYTGSWTNNESQTGYDVVLKPADISEKKLEALDRILEKGESGRSDADVIDADEKPAEDKDPKVVRLEKKIKKEKEREKKRLEEEEKEKKMNEDAPKEKPKPKVNDNWN